MEIEVKLSTDAGAEHKGEAECLEIDKTLTDTDMKSIMIFWPSLLQLCSRRNGFHHAADVSIDMGFRTPLSPRKPDAFTPNITRK